MKRALNNYLELPTHSNDYTQIIYKRQIIRAHMFYLALLYFYQNDSKFFIIKDYSKSLLKIASTNLVSEYESFYQKIITKTKNWYLDESKNLSQELSSKKLDNYFNNLAIELGIDIEQGNIPFT